MEDCGILHIQSDTFYCRVKKMTVSKCFIPLILVQLTLYMFLFFSTLPLLLHWIIEYVLLQCPMFYRIKMCTTITKDHWNTVHHELGHVHYFMAYDDKPNLFRGGANPGIYLVASK